MRDVSREVWVKMVSRRWRCRLVVWVVESGGDFLLRLTRFRRRESQTDCYGLVVILGFFWAGGDEEGGVRRGGT